MEAPNAIAVILGTPERPARMNLLHPPAMTLPVRRTEHVSWRMEAPNAIVVILGTPERPARKMSMSAPTILTTAIRTPIVRTLKLPLRVNAVMDSKETAPYVPKKLRRK
eukprot:525657_1